MTSLLTRGTGLLVLLVLLALPAQAQQDAPAQAPAADEHAEEKEAALQAAEAWLVYIDEEEYAESWDAAAEMLQGQVTSDKWEQSLQGVAGQTGALNERAFQGTQYTTELPNVPEGEYVIVQYLSDYANVQANEIVVLTSEDDAWKVAGYLVRPAPQPQQGAPQQQGGGQ